MALRKIAAPLLLLMVLATLFLVPSAYAYHNTKYNFSITTPEGWLVKEQTGGDAVVITDSYVSYTGASVNVAVEETSGTLAQVTAEAKQELNSTLDNWQLVSEGSRVINGINCYEVVGTWNYSLVEMKSKQVLAVENGKMFILSCAALNEQYEHSEPDFESCLASFTIGGDTSQTGAGFNSTLLIVLVAVVIVAVIGIAVVLAPRKKRKHH